MHELGVFLLATGCNLSASTGVTLALRIPTRLGCFLPESPFHTHCIIQTSSDLIPTWYSKVYATESCRDGEFEFSNK